MSEQQFPEPTVGVLISNPEGKIFLMKSHKWKGNYVVPGGHIEVGEKIEDTIKREVMEETGLDVHDIKFLCFGESIFDKTFWKKKHFVFFDFICKTNSSQVKLNSEGQEYTWISLKEALNLQLETGTRYAIETYMKKFPK